MNPSVPDTYSEVYWTILSGSGTFESGESTTANANEKIGNLNSSDTHLRWTVRRGKNCVLSDDLYLTNNTVKATITQQPALVCSEKDIIKLTGSSTTSTTSTWELVDQAQGTGNFVNTSTSDDAYREITGIEHSMTAHVRYTVKNTAADNKVCESVLDYFITDEGFVAVAGNNDITACSDSYTLSGSLPAPVAKGVYTGLWTVDVGTTAAIDGDATIPDAKDIKLIHL